MTDTFFLNKRNMFTYVALLTEDGAVHIQKLEASGGCLQVLAICPIYVRPVYYTACQTTLITIDN